MNIDICRWEEMQLKKEKKKGVRSNKITLFKSQKYLSNKILQLVVAVIFPQYGVFFVFLYVYITF